MLGLKVSRLVAVAAGAAICAVAGCADRMPWSVSVLKPGTVPAFSDSLYGRWLLHIDGGRFDANVAMLSVDSSRDSLRPLLVRSLPSLDWTGHVTEDLASVGGTGALLDHMLELTLPLKAGSTLTIHARVAGDTLVGIASESDAQGVDTDHPVTGVWVAPELSPVAASGLVRQTVDSVPLVVLRLDDAVWTDRDFVGRVRARNLTAEIAVPTQLVGQPYRLTWDDLRVFSAQGFGVVAHSRWHRDITRGDAEFLSEVVGAFDDLAREGLASDIFVQPGSWSQAYDFDSPEKLRNWRGSLMRTVSSVFENYVWRGSQVPTDSIRWGLGWTTVSDGATQAYVLDRWRHANTPGHLTVFQVHTGHFDSPGELDWFLDTLASAQAQGRIRMIPLTTLAFGPRP